MTNRYPFSLLALATLTAVFACAPGEAALGHEGVTAFDSRALTEEGEVELWLALEQIPAAGRLGTAGRPLTPEVSIAVPNGTLPLGASVWIDSERRWFVADDYSVDGSTRLYTANPDRAPVAMTSRAYVSRQAHAPNDPSPYFLSPTQPLSAPMVSGPGARPTQPGTLPDSIPTLEGAVAFSWAPVDGATGYQLEVHQWSDNAWSVAWQQSQATTSLAWTPPAERLFVWRVRAVRTGAEGPWSATSYFNWRRTAAQQGTLGVPTQLSPGAVGGSTVPANIPTVEGPVTFDWTAVPDATGYEVSIQRWTGSAWEDLQTLTSATDSAAWTAPASPNALYTWRVRSLRGAVYSDRSPYAFFYWRPAPAPLAAPTLLTHGGVPVVDGAPPSLRGAQVALTWSAVEGATRYDVELFRWDPASNQWVLISSSSSLQTWGGVAMPLTAGGSSQYAWRVRAHDGTREGAWAAAAYFHHQP